MSLLIQDVVVPNENARFANDIQLGWYPSDERNIPLAKGYIFTKNATAGYVSSIDVLDAIRNSFRWDGSPNRHVVVATYGHGKSHLALALANFFGKPAGSPESDGLLAQIEHAVGSEATAATYRDFKREKAPYLVVRLRGDKPERLRQQLLNGIETALVEHECTKDIKLPFWYDKAERVLSAFSSEAEQKANELLADHHLDLDSLILEIRQRKANYDLCREVYYRVHGVHPDFGGEISLEYVVEQTSDLACGEGKLSGILILFDEFSAFIHRYAQRFDAGADTSLQDMLDGVANRPGKVGFVAFSQFDPDTVAGNAFRTMGRTDGLADLRKELERLPQPQRYHLYSCIETVLDSYLGQPPAVWDEFTDASPVQQSLVESTDRTLELFDARYNDSLGWDDETLQKVVTEGCFPLHPVTTALLSGVEFQEVTAPRSVVGFVLDKVKQRCEQPALSNGRPNWVYATEIVDDFSTMLGEKDYAEYLSAYRKVGPEITDEETAALKAMLLHSVGRMKSRRMGFTTAVSELTGYSAQVCGTTLDDLARRGYIKKDDIQGTYTFWTVGKSLADIERRLAEKIDGDEVDWSIVSGINGNPDWQQASRMPPIEVQHGEPGAPEEWAAVQKVLTSSTFTPEYLQRIVARWDIGPNGIAECPRGVVVRLIPATDEDVEVFRSTAEDVIDSIGGIFPVPVVVCIPAEPRPQLLREILKEKALKSLEYEERKEFGDEMCDTELRQIRSNIDREVQALCKSGRLVVSSRYRTAVNALPNLTVQSALNECYRLAYQYTPKFVTHLKSSAPKLRTGVESVAKCLATNRLSDSVQTNPVAELIIRNFLTPGNAGSWSVVGVDHRIRPPEKNKAEKAWQVLCDRLKPGVRAIPLKGAVIELMNPPYGYGCCQLTLLLCAWYGYYRHDIQMLADGGVPCSLDDYVKHLSKPKDFLDQLCYVSEVRITRQDREQELAEIRGIIENVRDTVFSRAAAVDAQGRLRAFSQDERNDAVLRRAAEDAHEMLSKGLELSGAYDTTAAQVLEATRNATQVSDLAAQLRTLGSSDLPTPTCVVVSEPDVDELRERVLEKMTEVVAARCARLREITDVGQHGQNERDLKSIRTQLQRLGLTQHVAAVDAALEALAACRARLDAVSADRVIVAQVTAMEATNTLVRLRDDLKALMKMKPATDAVTASVGSKRAELEAEIESLANFARSLPDSVDAIATVADVRALRGEIQRRLDRYSGSPESLQLESALRSCDQAEGVLADAERIINSASGTGPLTSLRRDLQALESLTGLSEKYKQRRDQKLDVVRSAIESHTGFAGGLSARIDAASSAEELTRIREEIMRHHSAFEGSEETSTISAQAQRCQDVAGFLSAVASTDSASPASPDDLDNLLAGLRGLQDKCQTQLSSVHTGLIPAAEERLAQFRQSEELKAVSWLETLEEQLAEHKEIDGLLGAVGSRPPFLPSDAVQRLDALKAKVQDAVDQDQAVQVKLHFRRISGRARQMACLKELEQLLQGVDSE